MFDIGFWELVIIAVVGLLVVGPERLPGVVRQTGRWMRAARRYIAETRYEIERELDLDPDQDFKKTIADLDDLMKDAPDRQDRKTGRDPGDG